MSVVIGPLPVLNFDRVDDGSYRLSRSLQAQLDLAFRPPFSAADFAERDRFPDWKVVTVESRPGGERWLVREAARAHIWVDVDVAGQATAWRACTRAEARALDRAWSSHFPRALRERIAAALPPGAARPRDLGATLGQAWLHVEHHRPDGSGEGLSSLGPPGVLRVRWDFRGAILEAEPLTGTAAYHAIRQAAHDTGEWQAPE